MFKTKKGVLLEKATSISKNIPRQTIDKSYDNIEIATVMI